jgi:hypothetical protein
MDFPGLDNTCPETAAQAHKIVTWRPGLFSLRRASRSITKSSHYFASVKAVKITPESIHYQIRTQT